VDAALPHPDRRRPVTAQQPEVNMVRVAVQALGGGAGGTVAAHQLYDEAIALPTEKAARLALAYPADPGL